jgi:hypothetical protein
MQDHPGDALLRYEFARENLAAIDADIQAARLDSHIKAAITLSGVTAAKRGRPSVRTRWGHDGPQE